MPVRALAPPTFGDEERITTMTPAAVAILVAAISVVVALPSALSVEVLRRRANAGLELVKHDLAVERDARSRNVQLELVRAYQNPVLRSPTTCRAGSSTSTRGFAAGAARRSTSPRTRPT